MQKFLQALIESAFDRVDSSVPPCVTTEEAMSEVLKCYRWGIIEVVLSTLQSLSAGPWAMVDINTMIGLSDAVDAFVAARVTNDKTELPAAGPIVAKFLELPSSGW